MSLRLTVIGCSGSLPGPRSAASCYLVQSPTTSVVLDLGNGALGPLQQYLGPHDLDAVLISHLHPDHFVDLCGLYVALRYGPQAGQGHARLPVWGPASIREHVTRAYGVPAEHGMNNVMDFYLYPEDPVAETGMFTVGDLGFRIVRVEHPVPAYAVRVEHGGRSLVYSGDTAPSAALVDLAAGADTLLCEAAFRDGADNPCGIHLTGSQAGEHAQQAGVGRLVVTHVPPWSDPQEAASAASTTFTGPIEVAAQGLTLDI
ncbi:MAG TPA: MBL fold metallo-hydrolase [Jiangellaceae bacterium]|nr:MBL fold metallo-hydrolase [Jiangellaceae bacterium]